jgi:hypothetical protein
MELGQYQLQVFVSLVVILGAAFVALICDFLKGNNEQLRQLTIELRVRQEEEQKRRHILTPRAPHAPKVETIEAPPAPVLAARKERSALTNERKRNVNSGAIAAMERGAALAGSATPAHSVQESKPVVSQQQTAKPPIAIPRKDWVSLLNRNAQRPATSAPSERSLPRGFRDGFTLGKLIQSRQPVSGLVVSIGVNAARNSDRELSEAVSKLVASLIGADDFAAQSGDDEFLLIYPQERGASAQRRLNQIAQQLWDFQLRNLGSFQTVFSWGGIEVRGESIEEAIASASERMQETKRGRLLTMESPAHLRKAV